jgi:hypothetical protein
VVARAAPVLSSCLLIVAFYLVAFLDVLTITLKKTTSKGDLCPDQHGLSPDQAAKRPRFDQAAMYKIAWAKPG